MSTSNIERLGRICIANLQKLRDQKKLYRPYPEYWSRLMYELRVIKDLGYENIFLITMQFIQYAKSKGVVVGPGRGSAAGSLVCHTTGITSGVDPLRFGLRFERFLNPSRVTSADIDVDFSDREVPIEFLRKVYGENKVIQVGTKGLFKIKSALDEFAKVFGVSFAESKMITSCYDDDGSVLKADELAQWMEKFPDLFNTAKFFADSKRFRNVSKHPSAVIVTKEPIGRLIPLQSVVDSKTHERVLTTEWDGDELESIGYTKFDILRVSVLDVIRDTITLVKKHSPNALPDAPDIWEWISVRLDDKKTLRLANDAELIGIFQLWKPECLNMFKAITVRGFEDFYHITTVIRPGIDRQEYIEFHENPSSVVYLHPKLEPILKNTYGIILYQEQIMDICHYIAGFTLAEADTIRKIIAKTSNIGDSMSLKPHEKKFIDGCIANGVEEQVAKAIWQEILNRQRYGFNLCVSGSTEVTRATTVSKGPDCGQRNIRIDELWRYFHGDLKNTSTGFKYRGKRGLKILSMVDNRIKIDKIKNVIKTGSKITHRLVLESGNFIRATFDHKFMTSEGWKRLSEISIGDQIAINGGYEETDHSQMLDSMRCSSISKNERIYKKNVQYYQKGELNSSYIDGAYSKFISFRNQSIQEIGCCQNCGKKDCRFEVAHIDGNHQNNEISNLKLLCASCHKKHDYENNNRQRRFGKGLKLIYSNVVDICDPIEEETYDIEMCGDSHNYVANGIVTHNSHAVAYSLISFVCAYLKAHHPLEFLCSSLNDKNESRFIEELRKLGFKILPPDVQIGKWNHSIENGCLRIGYGHIKNVGHAAENIEKLRPFQSYDDFISRSKLSSDILSCLEKCSALDSLPRYDLSGNAKQLIKNESQKINAEKELLGYYVTGNPLDPFRVQLKDCETDSNCTKKSITVGGIVSKLKTHVTQNMKTMAFLSIQTLGDEFELTVWPEEWNKISQKIGEGKIIMGSCEKTKRGTYCIGSIKILSA